MIMLHLSHRKKNTTEPKHISNSPSAHWSEMFGGKRKKIKTGNVYYARIQNGIGDTFLVKVIIWAMYQTNYGSRSWIWLQGNIEKTSRCFTLCEEDVLPSDGWTGEKNTCWAHIHANLQHGRLKIVLSKFDMLQTFLSIHFNFYVKSNMVFNCRKVCFKLTRLVVLDKGSLMNVKQTLLQCNPPPVLSNQSMNRLPCSWFGTSADHVQTNLSRVQLESNETTSSKWSRLLRSHMPKRNGPKQPLKIK